MRNSVEIRQVDVGRGKAGEIRRGCSGDLRRFSVLKPDPNYVLDTANCCRLRLRLTVVGNIACLIAGGRVEVDTTSRDAAYHCEKNQRGSFEPRADYCFLINSHKAESP